MPPNIKGLSLDSCCCQHYGLVEGFSYVELCLFAVVPLVNGSEVAHDSGVDFATGSAGWAFSLFAFQVAMRWAYAKRWSQCEVGQVTVFGYLLD